MAGKLRLTILVVVLVSLLGFDTVAAADRPLPGNPCPMDLPGKQSDWTEQEHWVWKEVCEYRTADLKKKYGGKSSSFDAKDWPEKRNLRQRFLKAILMNEPYRSIPVEGVRISGARFRETLNLENGRLEGSLRLEQSRIDGDLLMEAVKISAGLSLEGTAIFGKAQLMRAKIDGLLNMQNVHVTGELGMEGVEVGHLLMRGARLKAAKLSWGKIGGTLSMERVEVTGALEMYYIQSANLDMTDTKLVNVGLTDASINGRVYLVRARLNGTLNMEGAHLGHLVIQQAKLDNVILARSKVNGILSMDGTEVTGWLNMDSIYVGKGLYMRTMKLAGADLSRGKIDGIAYLDNTIVLGGLVMESVQITQHLIMRRGKFTHVHLVSLSTGGHLVLSGSTLGTVILMHARVGGTFAIGSSDDGPAQWDPDAMLFLRDTSAYGLQDSTKGCKRDQDRCLDAWPKRVDLSGFTYQQFGGLETEEDMASRPAEWWEGWLAKHEQYSPQPYEQLASVLRKFGYEQKAYDILYAGKNRNRAESPWPTRLWLTMHWALIGYGLRLHRALGWTLLLILLGAGVLRISGEGPRNRMPYGIAYSFDLLLPIVKLREHHYNIDLHGWSRYYFYAHRLMGYMLASFLIAGLAGLTK